MIAPLQYAVNRKDTEHKLQYPPIRHAGLFEMKTPGNIIHIGLFRHQDRALQNISLEFTAKHTFCDYDLSWQTVFLLINWKEMHLISAFNFCDER